MLNGALHNPQGHTQMDICVDPLCTRKIGAYQNVRLEPVDVEFGCLTLP